MHRITFIIGQGKDKNGEDIQDVESLKTSAYHHLAYRFGGYTATLGYGGWKDDDGIIWQEPSLVLVVLTDKLVSVNSTARFLRDLFKQTCVAVTVEPVAVEFI